MCVFWCESLCLKQFLSFSLLIRCFFVYIINTLEMCVFFLFFFSDMYMMHHLAFQFWNKKSWVDGQGGGAKYAGTHGAHVVWTRVSRISALFFERNNSFHFGLSWRRAEWYPKKSRLAFYHDTIDLQPSLFVTLRWNGVGFTSFSFEEVTSNMADNHAAAMPAMY